jgi:hypothetical protein
MSPTHEIVDQYLRPLWQQLTAQVSVRECGELLVSCCSLAVSLMLLRTKRWLIELLERERRHAEKTRLDDRQREFYRQKEIVRTTFEASQIGSALTLEELLANTELDFDTRSSGAPSAPSVSSSTTPKPRP